MAEFTFVCPNRPVVRTAILDHLQQLCLRGGYQGFFLDRIRFPSPTTDPIRWLACLCPDCQQVAAAEGVDLAALAPCVTQALTNPATRIAALNALFTSTFDSDAHPDLVALHTFLAFRCRSISRFVQAAVDLLHAQSMGVGLDTFSPALTRLVGQDLAALAPCADWVKPMSYCHTLGPAGLPFELLGLADWLMTAQELDETTALRLLQEASGLPLPSSCATLRKEGLASATLVTEMRRARQAGIKTLLAGVELVELPGVAELTASQIERDQLALRRSGVEGVVLSWDLWHMARERLEQVARLWAM